MPSSSDLTPPIQEQLHLGVPLPGDNGVYGDFIVTQDNHIAARFIMACPPVTAILTGPAGSGKTHLASLWQNQNDAAWFSCDCEPASAPADIPPGAMELIQLLMQNHALVIDHADHLSDFSDETGAALLFHLLNLADQHGFHLLLTARTPPAQLFSRTDLTSRLRSMPHLCLPAPDDSLLETLLIRRFDQYGIIVPANVITYLLRRMARCAHAIDPIVAAIDSAAQISGSKITRRFVASIFSNPQNVDSLGLLPNQL